MAEPVAGGQFIVQVRDQADAVPVDEHFADIQSLSRRLEQITADQIAAGARARWRRQNQPGVWLDIETGGYPLVMAWTCEFCNTRIASHTSRPECALENLDQYAPHDHDGQTVTVQMAKSLVREAYAALATVPGTPWVLVSDIFLDHLGAEFRTQSPGARCDPRRTAETAMILMAEQDPDFAINQLPENAPADGHRRLVHAGGWGDAILIGPILPKPVPDQEGDW